MSYEIHVFHRDGVCQLSGRQGEAVEVSSREHGLDHAILSVRELVKLMRFHDLQAHQNAPQSLTGHGTDST